MKIERKNKMPFKHYKQIKTQELPSMNIKKNINNQNKL